MKNFFCIYFWILAGCVTMEPETQNRSNPSDPSVVPFILRDERFVVVPMLVNSQSAHFVLDTGIGINLVDSSMCKKVGCKKKGTYTGKRMSGQEVTVSLTSAELEIGGYTKPDIPIGFMDLSGFLPKEWQVDGFVSLNMFSKKAFTVNYDKNVIILESAESLEKAEEMGIEVPVVVHSDGPATDISMSMHVQGLDLKKVAIDTGSGSLILDEKYLNKLSVNSSSQGYKEIEGKDESGGKFRRIFTTIAGPVYPAGKSKASQKDVKVMFQKIIYDGLIGTDYLSQYNITYDLPNRRMILNLRKKLFEHETGHKILTFPTEIVCLLEGKTSIH